MGSIDDANQELWELHDNIFLKWVTYPNVAQSVSIWNYEQTEFMNIIF